GVVLVGVGFYTAAQPTIYRSSSFWTSSPTWFAIRAGVLMASLPLVWWLGVVVERAGASLSPLERLGRASLFVYWIHVELVYGYATWAIHGRLPLWGTLTVFVAFSTLMYGAVVV